MSDIPTLETARLILRGFRESDLVSFAAMNADPRVMATIGPPLSREASENFAADINRRWQGQGLGLWAGEVSGLCIGFIGLNVPSFEAPFTPCVEVGWRLSFDCWGKGYATEGGAAALAFGFKQRGLKEIVAFTAATNLRSAAVMRRLDMARNLDDDFDHPRIAAGDPLRRHILYRKQAA